MRKSRFTEEQIVAILKEQEAGIAVTRDISKHQIAPTQWKAKYGGLDVWEAPATEGAGGRERQAQADAGRGDAGQRRAEGSAGKNGDARRCSGGRGVSAVGPRDERQRRAIRVIGKDRSAVRYRSTRPDDAPLRERLKALAHDQRSGYRRLHVLLREGLLVNRKRVQRLYREGSGRCAAAAVASGRWANSGR